ncbi:toprim domain-containing protein [Mesorhizobium delmotii]|nr:toprim domain-containing protein [Mesorhizobium delmotii]
MMGNFGMSPVWSTMTAGTLAGFPVLPGVECLSIFADNDRAKMQAGRLRQAGNEAARKCADTWAADGRESIIWTPPNIGTDFNDISRRAAA